MLTCFSDTVMGSFKTIQVTLSCRGGVVSEPRYVQYFRLLGRRHAGLKPLKSTAVP